MPDQTVVVVEAPPPQALPAVGVPFECVSIPIEITKKEMLDSSSNQPVLDETGKPVYYCGFSIGGGIDQDHNLSPQKYPDNGIYVTVIKPDGPAAASDLAVHDKILQVNGYDFTLVTHKKAVEYIKKGKTLNMLVARKQTPHNDSVSTLSS